MLHRQCGDWDAVLLGALMGLTACPYDAAVRQLSPAEQVEFEASRTASATCGSLGCVGILERPLPPVLVTVQIVKPRRAPAFGPARHWRFAGGALTPPLTKGMLTPPWNPSIRFPAPRGGA
jgi:hypothetical protein